MTDTSTLAPRISEKPTGGSYIEWSAIFAGAIIASAIIVLMTAFGSALGLSLVSPYKGPSPLVFYIALALWFVWIKVSSFVAGGYIAGRMRRPIEGATTHESQVRDGVHGLVVWAVAVAIGAMAGDLVDFIRGQGRRRSGEIRRIVGIVGRYAGVGSDRLWRRHFVAAQ